MKLNHIKSDFDKRKIQPSDDAWEQLAKRLDKNDQNKKKPYVYWIGAVAAVLLIALLAYPLLSKSVDEVAPENSAVVDGSGTDKVESIKATSPNEQVSIKENDAPLAVEENQSLKEATTTAIPKTVLNKVARSSSPKSGSNLNDQIAANSQRPIAKSLPVKEENQKSPVLNTEMASQRVLTKNEFNTLTPQQEADLLLNEALAQPEKYNVASRSIHPEQLLRETEWDIELERRNRVNEGLKNGLGILKNEAYTLIRIRE